MAKLKSKKKSQTKRRTIKPARNRQLIRAILILKDFLFTKRINTIETLAKKFKVHQKTIKRDLKAIEASGFKIKRSDKKGGGMPVLSLKKK